MKVLQENAGNGIVILKLNRPEAKNAVDFDVINLLNNYLDELEKMKDLRFLIITGQDGVFCSGGDVTAFHKLQTAKEAETMLLPMNRTLQRIKALPCPVITFVDGAAVGGGAELASVGDLIYVSPRTSLGFIQGKLALTTGWGGAALTSEKIGKAETMRLLGSAQKINTEELLRIGFANGRAENITGVIDQLNWKTPNSVLYIYKQHLQSPNLAEEMEREARYCAACWESEEHHIAVDNFINKRSSY
ncbi:enoyl-CoA hydratase/isomerase family protein [Alkalicoccus halolimnae]|uniref:Enoyl-CoA hydratase/isomerase family protein n=1 Tax=Alkalicoccus halolimnae TaxID=1667239 RepID=A0A5C7F9N1_9BACI|nr:enoyl-CoA hydratase/isomerase family protein [Alkalicoccus halolimnae]TXF87441.1 enoyl-CoA hydratase/isomerase family protein [Alkalicoccus halolimnae]